MPEQAPTLRDMIKASVDRGLTYEQLSKRAVDEETGRRASPALLNNIANDKVDRMPYDYHLRAIALGLGVPYERVRQAAIAQWLPPEAGTTVADIPPERRDQLIADAERLYDITGRILAEARGEQATEPAERGGAA